MVTQAEFESTIAQFDDLEPARSPLYKMGLNLLKGGFEVEAYLLILATWNFARFRYVLTSFDLGRFRSAIEATKPAFERLAAYPFESANFDEIADDVYEVYSTFKQLVDQTGASKLLHFKHPSLFVMWDTAIRKQLGIRNRAEPHDYLRFLKMMQRDFAHIKWTRTDKTLVKAIDEYNFVIAHPRKRRKTEK